MTLDTAPNAESQPKPAIEDTYDTKVAQAVKPKKRRRGRNLLIVAALGVLVACASLVFGVVTSSSPTAKATATARAIARATEATRPTNTPGPTATPKPTNTPRPTNTPKPPTLTPTPVPTAPPFREIRDTVKKMTEAQWKAYLRGMKGLRVESWSGWVEDVNEKFLGGYELWVDLDPPDDPWSGTDVIFDIPDNLALKLMKDQLVTFSGRIESVGEFLGSLTVYLADVTLEISE